jgi:hypothetical protein
MLLYGRRRWRGGANGYEEGEHAREEETLQ